MRKIQKVICLALLLAVAIHGQLAFAQSFDYTGEWTCVAVDFGDGIKLKEYEGSSVGDLMKLRFNEDGIVLVISMGNEISGTWNEAPEGISAVIDGQSVLFMLQDGQLVNSEDGITAYLEKIKAEPKPGGLLSLIKGSKYLGKWVPVGIDEGDGIIKDEFEGLRVADVLAFQINRDGTLMMTSLGVEIEGTWQEIEGGINVTLDGQTTELIYGDNQLAAYTEGVIIYLVRAETAALSTAVPTQAPPPEPEFAGRWEANRYETMGYTFDIKMLFPEGCFVTLFQDGTGEALISKDYTESLTWFEKDGLLNISGSYVLSTPFWDSEKKELSMFYGSSAVVLYFQKTGNAVLETSSPSILTEVPLEIVTAKPTAEPTPQPSFEPTAEPTATQKPISSLEDKPLAVQTSLFSLTLFGEGWQAIEGWQSDSADYAASRYELKDASGSVLASLNLTAGSEGVRTYRDKIKTLNSYAEKAGKDTLEEILIGGISFSGTLYEKWGWKYFEYTARVPESGMTLLLTVEQPEALGDKLQKILDSVLFTLPVLTPPNIDPPLPEDGERYQPTTGTAAIGNVPLKASWLKTDEPIFVDSVFDNRLAFDGKNLFALAGKTLYAFTLKDDSLVTDFSFSGGKMSLDDEFEYLAPGQDGILYVSQGIFNILAIKEGRVIEDNNISGFLAMHPSGDWGISFWANADPKLVKASNGKLTQEPWVLSNLSETDKRQGRFSSISCVSITQTRIYIAGTDALENDANRVAVYDLEGKELFTFGAKDWSSDDAFGSVTDILETTSGILVQDGNYRAYKLFSPKGEFLGQTDCDELLGTEYPWLSSMIQTENGILVAVSQSRQDESADELLIFRLNGL